MKKLLLFLPIILILSCNSEGDNSTIENNCDFTSEIILEEDFNAINTSNYGIIEVELNGDCLGITFGSLLMRYS